MKFGKTGQVVLVSTIALAVASLFTACGSLNVGFLFVPANRQTPGQIQVYEVDSESGSLRTIPTSPFPSGGRDPIAEVADAGAKNLYVANLDDNNVVQFGIGTDGKLYPSSTVNTPGSFPLAITLNNTLSSTQSYLYGLDTLSQVGGCSLTNPCPGNLFVCPVNSDASLGTPVDGTNQCLSSYPLQLTPTDTTTVLTPTAIDVLANGQFVYVTAYSPASGTTPSQGYIFSFAANADGSLTALNNGYPAALFSQPAGAASETPLQQPVAILSDSASSFVYVLDKTTRQVATYAVESGGVLSGTATSDGKSFESIASSTIATGNLPSSMTLFLGKFLYVTNSADSTVNGYVASSGTLSLIGTYASDTQPIAITGDPRQAGFLYTVNFLGNSISGFQVDPNSGALINTQRTPYASLVQPTAIAGIPHGGTTNSSTATKSSAK